MARSARTVLMLLLASACLACSPSTQATVQPHRDQVAFFERPRTWASVKSSGEKVPTLVLIEPNPWAMVIGSDSPAFAAYEDGTVIWRTSNGFRTTRLNGSELDRLIAGMDPDALRRSYGRYEASDWTDQPEEELLLYRGGRPAFISVYGSLKSPDVRAKIPREIVTAFDRLKAFHPAESVEWLPDRIEVMVWPYEYAPEPSIQWPKDLPDLSDPRTIKRGDSFSIFVTSSRLAEVRALLARTSGKGAIDIDGKEWSASIRFPFPTERLWMAPNTEVGADKN